jgi:hypothetical protein
MAKSDPIERALDRLGELRQAEVNEAVTAELRDFLRSRSNLVVAKAAKVAGELRITALLRELAATFDRLMVNAPKLDKRCAATSELLSALYELDYIEPEPYLKGLSHVQLEASFGPPVDEGAKLRAISAQGLLRTRHPSAIAAVIELLVDREPAARAGAVRALATNGGETGLLLLRLKVLCGDSEVEVLAECFAGLLSAASESSLTFVGRYIDSPAEATAEAAMLALGESRSPAAYMRLKEKWDRTLSSTTRKILMVAMAASRLDEAIAFLVSLVREGSMQTADNALEALTIYRHNERVKAKLLDAVTTRDERTLRDRYRRDFEGPS